VQFQERAGLWFLTRHGDCSAALRDGRLSAALGQGLRRAGTGLPATMLNADGTEHARLRRPAQPLFGAEAMGRAEPRVARVAARLVDEAAGAGTFDVMADLAAPLSAIVLADLLGVPGADFPTFHRAARAASAHLDPLAGSTGPAGADGPAGGDPAGDDPAAYLAGYLSALVGSRRGRAWPGPGGGGAAASLCRDEVVSLLSLLVIGGYEPTAHMLGNAVLALLSHPGLWRRVAAEPGLVPPAVEELARCDPPVQLAARVAAADVPLGDRVVRAGQGVVVLLGAANHDPDVFTDPDRPALDRHPNPHLAFGAGPHFCLGAPLARVVARAAVAALAARCPRLALAGDGPERCDSLVPRGLRSLPVTARLS